MPPPPEELLELDAPPPLLELLLELELELLLLLDEELPPAAGQAQVQLRVLVQAPLGKIGLQVRPVIAEVYPVGVPIAAWLPGQVRVDCVTPALEQVWPHQLLFAAGLQKVLGAGGQEGKEVAFWGTHVQQVFTP